MLPLLFLVLGISALAAYGFSSGVRSRIDDYLRALRSAHEAHRAADEHLSNVHRAVGIVQPQAQVPLSVAVPVPTAPPVAPAPVVPAPAPTVLPVPVGPPSSAVDVHEAAQDTVSSAVDHAIAAVVANQQASQHTAEAAKIAQTEAERGAVTASAARVLDRGKKIEEALAHLGVGQCGVRSYAGVTTQIRDAILKKLHVEGMTVTGNNPWDIDTQQAGVKLRALWDPKTRVLRLIVTASSLLAPCSVIWGRIEPTLRGMLGDKSPS